MRGGFDPADRGHARKTGFNDPHLSLQSVSCARRGDSDGVFHELYNRRDNVRAERDGISLIAPVGPYRYDSFRSEVDR